ncbi:unnamed protein product [Effrenium voratum]|uniref:Uncharacterized protein n=2 Tax=Effrenium voratum TaxID=2562239 RepID=A0AA36N6R0_9DINO|nr:unnamed protein product [Effrenium voratum]CAJ1459809.1 unnamed protein product [Effrenium voratum]
MAPSRGPLEEAMKAKLRQMQSARDTELTELQEQLAANVAKAQQRQQELTAAEARLQDLAEVAAARLSSANQGHEQLRHSEAQAEQLSSKLEQAFAAQGQLETELMEAQRALETEAGTARRFCVQAQDAAAELHQVEFSAAELTEKCSLLRDERSADAQQHHQQTEYLRAELQAALATVEEAETTTESAILQRREAMWEREELRARVEGLKAVAGKKKSQCCELQ